MTFGNRWNNWTIFFIFISNDLTEEYLNSLPNEKILDQSKLKDLEDHKVDLNQKLNFTLGK